MKINRLAILACVSLLTACGQSVPDCDDSSVEALVVKRIHDAMAESIKAKWAPYRHADGTAEGKPYQTEIDEMEKLEDSEFSLDSYRTLRTDEQTGAKSCAATLMVNGDNSSQEISYDISLTDDGDELVVRVSGF